MQNKNRRKFLNLHKSVEFLHTFADKQYNNRLLNSI